jgi:hypothetical protein
MDPVKFLSPLLSLRLFVQLETKNWAPRVGALNYFIGGSSVSDLIDALVAILVDIGLNEEEINSRIQQVIDPTEEESNEILRAYLAVTQGGNARLL